MAPLPPGLRKPSARSLRAQRISGSIHPLAPPKTFRPDASTTDSFLDSKRDRKLIKHSSFLSRIVSSAGVSKPSPSSSSKRRRRPPRPAADPRRLATLDSLADALPDLPAGDTSAPDSKVNHNSLRSKKGALRRKERIVRGEMERFGASMASLANAPAATRQGSDADEAAVDRWAALRTYISATMKQSPATTK